MPSQFSPVNLQPDVRADSGCGDCPRGNEKTRASVEFIVDESIVQMDVIIQLDFSGAASTWTLGLC